VGSKRVGMCILTTLPLSNREDIFKKNSDSNNSNRTYRRKEIKYVEEEALHNMEIKSCDNQNTRREQ